jgi:AraC-like DNA-binding protein
MLFLKHVPDAPLSDFVEYLWLVRDAPSHAMERILPAGTLELVLNLHEDEIRVYDDAGTCRSLSGTVISGAYGRPFLIDTREHALTLGVHFRPGGAFPFSVAPPGELGDAHVDVQSLWGSAAVETLRDRLGSARSHLERFQILERALAPRARDARKARPVVQLALRALADPRASVRELVASSGFSHRYFTNVFREEVGITPKLFSRIRRFQRALTLGTERSYPNFARLAAECGYGDQGHWIRDFAAFARTTPAVYFRHAKPVVKDHHLALPGSD